MVEDAIEVQPPSEPLSPQGTLGEEAGSTVGIPLGMLATHGSLGVPASETLHTIEPIPVFNGSPSREAYLFPDLYIVEVIHNQVVEHEELRSQVTDLHEHMGTLHEHMETVMDCGATQASEIYEVRVGLDNVCTDIMGIKASI
jgi:hypothetical protein